MAASVRVRVRLRGHLEFDQTVTLSDERAATVDARLIPAPSHVVQFSLSSALAFRTGPPRLVDEWSTHYATSGVSRWGAYVTAALDARFDGAYAGPSSAVPPVLSAQAQLTSRLGVGIAVESVSRELAGDLAFKCSVARRATYYGQSTASTHTAEEAGAVSGLVSGQRAVHLAAIWRVPLTRRLAFEVSAGPSVFHITQGVPGDITAFTYCASGNGASWPFDMSYKKTGCQVTYEGQTERRSHLGVNGGVIAVMRLSGRLGLTAGLRAATAGTLSVPATSVTQQLRAANDLWPDFQYPLSAERSSIEVHTGFVEPLVGLRVTF